MLSCQINQKIKQNRAIDTVILFAVPSVWGRNGFERFPSLQWSRNFEWRGTSAVQQILGSSGDAQHSWCASTGSQSSHLSFKQWQLCRNHRGWATMAQWWILWSQYFLTCGISHYSSSRTRRWYRICTPRSSIRCFAQGNTGHKIPASFEPVPFILHSQLSQMKDIENEKQMIFT